MKNKGRKFLLKKLNFLFFKGDSTSLFNLVHSNKDVELFGSLQGT